jgi:hypothetical protein
MMAKNLQKFAPYFSYFLEGDRGGRVKTALISRPAHASNVRLRISLSGETGLPPRPAQQVPCLTTRGLVKLVTQPNHIECAQ